MTSTTKRNAKARQAMQIRPLVSLRVILVSLMVCYSLAGAYIFMKLEQPPEDQIIREMWEAKRKLLAAISYNQLPDLYHKNWTILVDKMFGRYQNVLEVSIRHGIAPGQTMSKWNLWGSLFYSSSVYTTIGYGNIVPMTTAGRVATIVYAIIGIPLCLVLLNNLSSSVNTAIVYVLKLLRAWRATVTAAITEKERSAGRGKELHSRQERREELRGERLMGLAALTAAYIIGGAYLYQLWEDWTFFEAVYFIFISLTTIGFGDFVPQQTANYILSSAYVFFGLALLSAGIGMLHEITGTMADLVMAKLEGTFGMKTHSYQTSLVATSMQPARRFFSFYAPVEWPYKVKRTNVLLPYKPPQWAAGLKGIPSLTLQLAQKPTLIVEWPLYNVPTDVKLYVKRDDMTGSSLSGNKVRKLEFVLADCLHRQCQHVITCGSLQSNHCRAVSVAAAQLGLKVHLFLRTDHKDPGEVGYEGNLLLDRLTNADIYLVPRKSPYKTYLLPRMEQLAAKLRNEYGETAYIVPVGGSDAIGLWGYVEAFQEMIEQKVLEEFDDVVVACGSGGTAAGLALGNYLTGSKIKLHAIAVCDDAPYFYNHINQMLEQVGVLDVKSEAMLNVVDSHKGKGYGLSTEDELAFVYEAARTTGIILDPTYTGKAAYGLWKELQLPSSAFRGRRVLFLHTGGIFGTYDMRIKSTLSASTSCARCGNSVKAWED